MPGVSRFDCFPSDFLNGIISLKADEIAVYTVVIMLLYDTGEPVLFREGERQLAMRSGMPIGRLEKAVASLVRMGKLKLEDGRLSQKRAGEELAKIRERISKNRENSHKGGEATKQRYGKNTSENNEGERPIGQPNGGPKEGPIPPSPVPQPPITTLPTGGRPDLDRIEAALRKAGGLDDSSEPGLLDLSPILGLIDAGLDLKSDILPVIRSRRSTRARSWGYFVAAIRESRGKREAAAKVLSIHDHQSPGPRAPPPSRPNDEIRNPMLRAGAKYFGGKS